jgi:hypothetical protein
MGNRVFLDPSATFGLSFQKIKFHSTKLMEMVEIAKMHIEVASLPAWMLRLVHELSSKKLPNLLFCISRLILSLQYRPNKFCTLVLPNYRERR